MLTECSACLWCEPCPSAAVPAHTFLAAQHWTAHGASGAICGTKLWACDGVWSTNSDWAGLGLYQREQLARISLEPTFSGWFFAHPSKLVGSSLHCWWWAFMDFDIPLRPLCPHPHGCMWLQTTHRILSDMRSDTTSSFTHMLQCSRASVFPKICEYQHRRHVTLANLLNVSYEKAVKY